MEKILSLTNEKVKLAASLKEKKYRDKYALFVGEGIRFSEMAAESDFDVVSVFFEPKILSNPRGKNLIENFEETSVNLYEVSEKIMQKISNTQTPQGILLVIKEKKYTLSDITDGNFFAVLDGVSDPGNLGTIIRLCDAVGVSGLITLKNCVDIYSDKVIRATMGSIFNTRAIQNVDIKSLINFANEKGLKIYGTSMNGISCYEKNLKDGGIFVFGSESAGVSKEILDIAETISLPIVGKAESLNVAVAASAILYETFRQQR